MEQATKTFPLTSGVECEVKKFTGKEQGILTDPTLKNGENVTEALKSILVRVGDITDFNDKFVSEEMLTCDKKKALVVARQFSMPQEEQEMFLFNYEYQKDNKKQEELMEVDLKGGFPERKIMLPKEGTSSELAKMEREEASFIAYDQVLKAKNVICVLPDSKLKVRYTMLDGKGELIGSTAKKKDRNSNLLIKMRRPAYFEGETPIVLDPTKLSLIDIEYLRRHIKETEGWVDTEYRFEHPDPDASGADKNVIVDLTGVTAFFFPSGAI